MPEKKKGAPRSKQGAFAGRPATKATAARRAALALGTAARKRNAFVQDLLDKELAGHGLEREERAFAVRLALGVASAKGTLDETIDRFLKKPADLQGEVRDALRISTYEILYLEKTPHAAVDQGVELVKAAAPRAAGLANAVLRKVARAKADFPFGDPAADDAALARLHAFPLWLAERLIADLGREAAAEFMAVSNEQAPAFIAVNPLKADDQQVIRAFLDCGTVLEPVAIADAALPGCYRLSESKALQDGRVRKLFTEGKVLVSDAASQAIAKAVLPKDKPERFLEIGAGRATKTILLQGNAQRRYGSQMHLTTLDNHEFKTQLLIKRVAGYGVRVDDARTGDATRLDEALGAAAFDAAFIDAPCSGVGTLRRHPEIRWRLDPESISALADTGLAMLKEAAGRISIGGMLSYATCTVITEENEGTIVNFLESPEGSGFRIDRIAGKNSLKTQLASNFTDAHFAVRLVRVK